MKPLKPLDINLEKNTLIEAGAGTGKTYTITTMVVRLVAAGYSLESILVVTFTEAAAAELKIRIRQRLSETLGCLSQAPAADDDALVVFLRQQNAPEQVRKRLSLALAGFDLSAVMTIHSFCYKVLKEHSFEIRSGFDIELVPDRSQFLRQAGYDFFMARVTGLDPLFINFLDSIQVTPETFIEAFKKVLARPDLKVIPPVPETIAFFDDYRAVLREIKAILESEADGVKDLIAGHKGLDKRSYSKKNVPKWLADTRLKLQREGEHAIFKMNEKGDALYKFSRERLESKIKPGSSPLNHPLFDLAQEIYHYTQKFDDHLVGLKHDFITFLKKQLEKTKIEQGILFFDDLVNNLARGLTGEDSKILQQAVQKKYKACLIDEFQDTDPRQYRIFSTLFHHHKIPFFMIGDPKQAIYAFRGGDIFAYLKACRQSEQRFTLETNYRSSPLLVKGVNQIFSIKPNPFGHSEISFFPLSTPESARNRLKLDSANLPPLRFCFLSRQQIETDNQGFINKKTALDRIPELVAREITSVLCSKMKLAGNSTASVKSIEPSDIAVLVRTNTQADQIQKALSACHIASYLSKTESVYDSKQALELYDILAATYEPDNTALIKGALATDIFHFNADRLRKMDEDESRYFFWHNFFVDCKYVWETRGFVAMIMKVMHSEKALLDPDSTLNERALTNLYHLVELISGTAQRLKLAPLYLMGWYADQLVPSKRQSYEDELRLESDRKAVAIVTIHKSKGLEYPIVYLPYLWEGPRGVTGPDVFFHDPENNDELTLDLGSDMIDQAIAASESEDRAEQARLLYVALTRASAMCNIIWGGFKSAAESSLGVLLHSDGACREDELMLDDIDRLISQAPESIECQLVQMRSNEQRWVSTGEDPDVLSAREQNRIVVPAWRAVSFSSIVQSAGSTSLPHLAQETAPGEQETIELENFPKGPNAGDFFHAVLERVDFRQEQSNIKNMVDEFAPRYGFTDKDLKKTAARALGHVIRTPMTSGDNGFRLHQIALQDRCNEMAFTLPVENLNGRVLKEVFKMSGQAYIQSSGYAQQVGQLAPEAVKGYLKGFIDLIVRYENRYYVIDYKSNYLGSGYADYHLKNMQTAMLEHHYFLQYHIYLTALHQYLKNSMDGYAYDKHMGGVYYLFIRGMHPDGESGNGIFYDRPDFKMIESFSKACRKD